MYTIIEDCSPYYIRFTWDGLIELINNIAIRQIDLNTGLKRSGYIHYNFGPEMSDYIMSALPMKDTVCIDKNRVALFVTPPGGKSVIHKDGKAARYSINLPIIVADDQCITNWYSDESLNSFKKENDDYSRVVVIDSIVPEATKSITVQPNECILFNTDIYHSWDNGKSFNERKILTLRDVDIENVFFNDIKEKLFT
jgi:hypothetical protein